MSYRDAVSKKHAQYTTLIDQILHITGCINYTQCLEEGRLNPTPTTHGFRGKSNYGQDTLSDDAIQIMLSYLRMYLVSIFEFLDFRIVQ